MTTLITCYSYSGNNEKLANELRRKISSDYYKISELKKRKTISILFDFLFKRNSKIAHSNLDVKKYDIIILIAPIWGGKIATPMRAFIEKEKSNFGKYIFITLCNGEIGQKDKIANELSSIIQHRPTNVIELWINNILPPEKRNKIKHTFNFKIKQQDLQRFDEIIVSFVRMVEHCGDVI